MSFYYNLHLKALEATSIEEAKLILDVESKTNQELEDMAIDFAFWNGNSKVPPTEWEDTLANICLDALEQNEQEEK